MDVQAKLLRVLQDRIVERVGGDRARTVDFRLVSATNQDLQSMVERGAFRLDLFYRISPIVIELPPLRERLTISPCSSRSFFRILPTDMPGPCPVSVRRRSRSWRNVPGQEISANCSTKSSAHSCFRTESDWS